MTTPAPRRRVERPEVLGPDDVSPPEARPVGVHRDYVAHRLAEVGRWGTETFADVLARHARERPDDDAIVTEADRLTWAQYEAWSDRVARVLDGLGLPRGARVGVVHPDGPQVHALYAGIEKAGHVIVGIGPRAGAAELHHLLAVTGARVVVTPRTLRDRLATDIVAELQAGGLSLAHHVTVAGDLAADVDAVRVDGVVVTDEDAGAASSDWRQRGLGEVWLLNSTSGTTGLPKCVVHHQDRWRYYHELAVEAGGLTSQDRFMSLISAPFGFGVWTAHTTPLLLGVPTVMQPAFSVGGALRLIERERVTVLACVTTQFIMMLNSPAFDDHDLSSLRVLFTGGEAVPHERSLQFEARTGAKVLQFYGSNETGALSRTTIDDSAEARLTTAGRVIAGMQVRLVDEAGAVSARGRGRSACAGPATCLGYWADDEANAQLITRDGLMLTGDVCTVDEDDYPRVVGRTSDFIIRGGKNISAAAVEEAALVHPAVAIAAAVAMPDEVFGERVCLFVELHLDASLTLDELCVDLGGRGVSKSNWPERLEVVDELPRASGGKVAKGRLRELARSIADVPST